MSLVRVMVSEGLLLSRMKELKHSWQVTFTFPINRAVVIIFQLLQLGQSQTKEEEYALFLPE